MFCQKCGNELAGQYQFCPACGSKNIGATQPRSTQSSSAPPDPGNNSAKGSGYAPHGVAYAGFWRRLLAYLLDALVLLVPSLLFGFLVGLGGGNEVIAQVLWLFVALAYFAILESSPKQATLGKRALGLRVCDMNGQRISLGTATGRYFGKILSFIVLCIGFLMVAFTERKQGLHDKLAGTLVLHQSE